jgi:DNA-binding NarL/FixJ family response regulator
MSSPLQVLVVDDHPLFRAGVIATLQTQADFVVCAEAHNAIEAREQASRSGAQVALIDLMLQDDDGLKLVRELRQENPRLRIVVLSMLDPGVYLPKALQAGASFFVSKAEGPQAIFSALRRAAANERDNSAADAGPVGELSERELQVFLQLGLGRSTQEIATALGVSVKTIESHREAIKSKLGLPHTNALVARAALWARQQGVTS